MITIDPSRDICTVLATITCADREARDGVADITARMLPIFAQQPGFLGYASHLSHCGLRVITYLQWETRAHYDACEKSNDFGDTGPALLGYLASGTAKIDVAILDVTAAAGA